MLSFTYKREKFILMSFERTSQPSYFCYLNLNISSLWLIFLCLTAMVNQLTAPSVLGACVNDKERLALLLSWMIYPAEAFEITINIVVSPIKTTTLNILSGMEFSQKEAWPLIWNLVLQNRNFDSRQLIGKGWRCLGRRVN